MALTQEEQVAKIKRTLSKPLQNERIPALKKCEKILAWHERLGDSVSFNPDFVADVRNKLARGLDPTTNQMKAIDNIISKFNVR